MVSAKVKQFVRNAIASKPIVVFAACLMIATMISMGAFMKWTVLISHRPHSIFAFCAADILLIYLPFWFVSPKWRKLVLIPLWAITVWLEINLLYFRSYHDLMPISSMLLVGNLDFVTLNSAKSLFRIEDLIIIAPSIIVTIACFTVFRHSLSKTIVSKREKVYAVAVTLLMFLLQQGFLCRQYHIAYHEDYLDLYSDMNFDGRQAMLRFHGLLRYTIEDMVMASASDIDLNESEVEDVSRFVNQSPEYPEWVTDSILANNRKKNLIFIVVESLNSAVIGYKWNGVEVSPFLNRLCDSDNAIVALDVVSQAGCGRSSDGQLIYNTGLLPLRDEVTVLRHADNLYPSLADALNRTESIEIIGENAGLWNHVLTNKSFGYDKLYDGIVDGVDKKYYDKAIFDMAARLLSMLPQPFYAQITTLGMHEPYDGVAGYVEAVKAFDKSLEQFVSDLMDCGLYDNSIIVIASDHNVDVSLPGSGMRDDAIMAVILNSGIGKKVRERIEQSDIYPTLLDVMSAGKTYHWRGMGKSILSGDRQCSVDKWDISEKIIRSDYFRRYCPGELIAHAAGSIDGHTYTNSLEALEKSIADGFKYIELDLSVTSDGKVVAVHDWATFHEMTDSVCFDCVPSFSEVEHARLYGKYTPLTPRLIDSVWDANPHLILVTDKLDDADMLMKAFPRLRHRLLVECFSKSTAKSLEKAGIRSMYKFKGLKDGILQKAFSYIGVSGDVNIVTCPTGAYIRDLYGKRERLLDVRAAVYTLPDTAHAIAFMKKYPNVRFVYTDNL